MAHAVPLWETAGLTEGNQEDRLARTSVGRASGGKMPEKMPSTAHTEDQANPGSRKLSIRRLVSRL